jgi:hypothetical protein
VIPSEIIYSCGVSVDGVATCDAHYSASFGKGCESYRKKAPAVIFPGPRLTVAYVPSPSFSSCWNELGCRLSIFRTDGSGSRFCTLMVLGRDGLSLCAVGEGGNVRYGGLGEGCCLVVYFGSKSNEAGVQRALIIANASFDPYVEAVVARGKQKKQMGCFLQDENKDS